MSRYRRANIEGGMYFFTVTLADRDSGLLVEQIDLLRLAYRTVTQSAPVETIAICILPEHLHAVWQLPPHDSDFSTRWQRIKAEFSRLFRLTLGVAKASAARAKKAYGSGGSGNTCCAMRMICKNILFHTLQPGETHLGKAGGGLAIFKLSSICAPWNFASRLGRKAG